MAKNVHNPMQNENDFDQEKLDALRKQLARGDHGHIIQARLEWVDNAQKGNVVFIPDPNGKFFIHSNYVPKT